MLINQPRLKILLMKIVFKKNQTLAQHSPLIPSLLLRILFCHKVSRKTFWSQPFNQNLIQIDFLRSLLVHLPLLTLFLQSEFLQSHHLLAGEIWGFTGVILKFPLYGKDTKGLTPHQNAILMCLKMCWLLQVLSQEEHILEQPNPTSLGSHQCYWPE